MCLCPWSDPCLLRGSALSSGEERSLKNDSWEDVSDGSPLKLYLYLKKRKKEKKRIQQNSWPAGKRPNLSNHLKFIYICTQTLRIIYTFWSSNSTFKNLFQGNNHKYIKWLAIGLSIIVALYNSENQGLPARPATGDCRNYIGPSSGIHGRLSKCCCRSVFLVMVKCSQYDIK